MLKNAIMPMLLALVLAACVQNKSPNVLIPVESSSAERTQLSAKFLPENNKVLLVVGQDLISVSDYVGSKYFPTPGGITTYLSFYSLTGKAFPTYGALGQDMSGDAYNQNVDWGAGPLNAHLAAIDYPDSALVIGLNIAEGSGNNIWAKGGLADIAVGSYDKHIRRLAKFCNQVKTPVYLRIGYEFDGAWNTGYHKRTSFILAFRRIVDLMREMGVTNVAYVWQASASPVDDVIDGRRENIKDWYPGDDYVDWMALSWFLPADERRHGAPTQQELANEVIDFARQKNKPVMIAEAAPQGYDLEQMTDANIARLWDGEPGSGKQRKSASDIWREWFAPLFDYIHAHSDVVRAMAYINADWDSQRLWSTPYAQGYWGDTRVQVNPEVRENWLNEISKDMFWMHGSSNIHMQLK